LRVRKVDIIDEHFYSSPEWFLQNSNRYDHYDRKGPKIFVGEYAAQSDRIGSMKNVNNLRTALSEAAFMTGIERNADVVEMASYAPLFAHVTDWQWTPNLIWFDNGRSYATPNYYVQQLFSLNKGTTVVPLLAAGLPVNGQDSCWGTACVDGPATELIIKVVNMSGVAKKKTVTIGDARMEAKATITVLSAPDPTEVNNMKTPLAVVPATTSLAVKGKQLNLELAPYSFSVVRVKIF
jgi:alpha-N-arabinofuranosidase